ncbi:MAG: alanine racemase [Nitrospinaceae bacterium]|nr:MAG: alanine racemase [Nitrospinaceae bacterium]
MSNHRATVAQIDLDAFKHNLKEIRSLVAPQVKIMAVVKADAYGHGAVPCAKAAVEARTNWLGVAILEEGIELRENGITVPILVMGSIFPNEANDLVRHDLSTAVSTLPLAEMLSQQAEKQGKTVGVHLKVDTGMGRLGMFPEDLLCLVERIQSLKNLRIEGIFTHLSSADEPDTEYTELQFTRLLHALTALKAKKIPLPMIHVANSAAILMVPDSHLNMVRPGIILYGALPSPDLKPTVDAMKAHDVSFRPVMSWKSKIIQINQVPKGAPLSYNRQFTTERDSLIATLPTGYGDGLNRALSNNMDVLIRGQRAPQVGIICMDLTLVDVTDIKGVQLEDEVVLIGTQGEETITADDMAEQCGTISYEILCNVSKRVPRVYLP